LCIIRINELQKQKEELLTQLKIELENQDIANKKHLENELSLLTSKHMDVVTSMNNQFNNEKDVLVNENIVKINTLKLEHQSEIATLQEKMNQLLSELNIITAT
jgi:uncharacterized protein YnzC (UPF0291/DUF896 family)